MMINTPFKNLIPNQKKTHKKQFGMTSQNRLLVFWTLSPNPPPFFFGGSRLKKGPVPDLEVMLESPKAPGGFRALCLRNRHQRFGVGGIF